MSSLYYYSVPLVLAIVIAVLVLNPAHADAKGDVMSSKDSDVLDASVIAPEGRAYAVFAAGCFWCVESEFQAIDGVEAVVSGYAGGDTPNPTYHEVSGKHTGHFEVVRVLYDPAKLSYARLLEAFWLIHDPTQADGQGVDIGPQYRSAILPVGDEQEREARAALEVERASGRFSKPIATLIVPITRFYEAEGYHQDYYEKKGIVYDSVFDLGGESTTMRKRRSWFGW